MKLACRIGVDGGGTKTECILIDPSGEIRSRQIAPGSNPSIVGAEQARMIVTDALCALVMPHPVVVSATALYMAGNRSFWQEFADGLTGFGRVTAADDSLPVLESATEGNPGLVLHAGTGSFVAARDPAGKVHYAGGLGWRFGDGGSGYDLGQRAVGRALLELQGWAPTSRLSATVRSHAQLGEEADATALTRYFYSDPSPNQKISSLAPAVLRLASEGDGMAIGLIKESVSELIELAERVAAKLFPGMATDELRAGLSGPILTHPVVLDTLVSRSPLPLVPITTSPIEGVRRLIVRGAG
jgi:N-acetylglucosamine kinase-like BadF-type ATPase